MSGFNEREEHRAKCGVAGSMIQSGIQETTQPMLDKLPKIGRRPNEEKKVQVSMYLTSEQVKTLRMQDAEKVKGADRSAIARVGIDIILALSNEEYLAMQSKANQRGVAPSQIVKEALVEYLKVLE